MKKIVLVFLCVSLFIGLSAQTVQIVSSAGAQLEPKSKVSALVKGTVGSTLNVGFCWTTNRSLPVYSESLDKSSITLDSSGTVVFDGDYELSKDTVYLIRAFAKIDTLIVYSDTMSIWLKASTETQSLALSDTLINFTADDIAKDVVVTASQDWSFTNSTTWLSAYKDTSNSDVLKIAATTNTESQVRTATIKITSGNLSKIVTILQSAAVVDTTPKAILGLSDSTLQYPYSGGQHTLVVASTNAWTFSKPVDWITAEKDSNNNLTISVSANTDTARKAYVSIASGNITKYVIIMQEGKQSIDTTETSVFEVSDSVLQYPSEGATHYVSVASTKDWTYRSVSNWISVVRDSSNTLAITTTANTDSLRTTYISVTNGTITKNIIIKQDGKQTIDTTEIAVFEVSDSIFNIPAEGATNYLGVVSTKDWTYRTVSNWISLKKDSTNLLVISVSANTDTARKSYITIVSGDKTKYIYVNQAAKEISDTTNPTLLELS